MPLPNFRTLVANVRDSILEKIATTPGPSTPTLLSPATASIVQREQQQGSIEDLDLMAGLSIMGSFPTPGEYETNVQHALESWPESLHALSLPSADLVLTRTELDVLQRWGMAGDTSELSKADPYRTWNAPRAALETIVLEDGTPITSDPVVAGLIDRINAFLPTLPFEKPFFKLGTRSGKDSPLHRVEDGRVSCGEHVVLTIISSRRLFADLANDQVYGERAEQEREMIAQARAMPIEEFAKVVHVEDLKVAERMRTETECSIPDHLPHLWFREYRRFPRHAEFRCFMNAGTYVGATQYHDIVTIPDTYVTPDGEKMTGNRLIKAEPLPELVRHGWEYDRILREYAPVFKAAATTMRSAIYDVVVDRENERVVLLETNPANSRTFPGLKDWSRPETFNGELDWVVESIDLTNEYRVRLDEEKIAELQAMAEDRERYLAERGQERTGERSR